ncbi:unnamed protein product [Peniophora sp. CBMAI 1063]|nr:unnamed protein product [Peniophora sp. CBMAI 1063]
MLSGCLVRLWTRGDGTHHRSLNLYGPRALAEPPSPLCVSRMPRLLFSERLRPITGLKGEEYLKAFLDIILGHHIAWTNGGIYHCDLNLTNTVYRKEGGKVCGVLYDFDLVSTDFKSHDYTERLERTGTLPYMTLDLLRARYLNISSPHLYRHDLEAFYWMLVWTCSCIVDGKEDTEGQRMEFGTWRKGDYRACHARKLQWEGGGPYYWEQLVQPSQMALWIIAKQWAGDHILRQRIEIVRLRSKGLKEPYEADPSATCWDRQP